MKMVEASNLISVKNNFEKIFNHKISEKEKNERERERECAKKI